MWAHCKAWWDNSQGAKLFYSAWSFFFACVDEQLLTSEALAKAFCSKANKPEQTKCPMANQVR
jgi:hypothetical protein